jgi:glycerophosphoryl diester phosphodiesterase
METDIRRTRDGYLVVMHDPNVDRTTDGAGPLAELTLWSPVQAYSSLPPQRPDIGITDILHLSV